MKHYIATSNSFQGELSFKYDLNGLLIAFEISAVISSGQRDWFFKNLPLNESDLIVSWAKSSKTLRITEVPIDLSFDAFYNKYSYKVGDKKKCIKLWSGLSDEIRTKALMVVPKYFRWLEATGTAKVYPERYLSKEYYNNDYR
jgi:hypothetical protein